MNTDRKEGKGKVTEGITGITMLVKIMTITKLRAIMQVMAMGTDRKSRYN